VLKLTLKQKEGMKEYADVGSSLSDEDVKEYVNEVLKQIKGN
jgi:hypothetical protein